MERRIGEVVGPSILVQVDGNYGNKAVVFGPQTLPPVVFESCMLKGSDLGFYFGWRWLLGGGVHQRLKRVFMPELIS